MIDGFITWSNILCTLIFGFFLYYLTQVVHKPKFYCSKQGAFYQRLKEHLDELDKDQWPLLWCFWPLWQAGFQTVIMPPQKFDFERKEILTCDGGSFTLDFYGFDDDRDPDENRPIVLILPGATGHSGKVYVREFIASAFNKKYRAVCLNFRGWGRGVRLKTEKLSCVGSSIEIEAALGHISNAHPKAPMMVVAFSIGACTFVNYLVNHGTKINANLTSALLLGVPWNPIEAKSRLSNFWHNLIINKHMTQNLIHQVKRNLKVVEKGAPKQNIDLKRVYESKTVWDFDDSYICPLYGYKNHVDFYEKVGLVFLDLQKISIPVLALCTEDDPLCRGEMIPYDKILRNPLLAVVTTKYGGHLTWLEGVFPTYKRFPHRVFEQYTDLFFASPDNVHFLRNGTTMKTHTVENTVTFPRREFSL